MVVNSTVTLCLKIAEKGFAFKRLHFDQKLIKMPKWQVFLNSVTRQISLNETKIAGKYQKIYSNETFLGDFQTI